MSGSAKYVGIDGGGTKCRAIVYDAQFNELSSAIAGPANVAKYGLGALEAIISATEEALQVLGKGINQESAQLFVSAGLAGVNVLSAAEVLAGWKHPFARFDYTTDIHTATLGAHSGQNGAVLIVGTGSCAAALKNGQLTQFGGHGFTLGDKGSGAWLGKMALNKVLEAFDGVGPNTALLSRLGEHLHISEASDIVDVYNQAASTAFAALAPIVISTAEDGDDVALSIVKDGAKYLSAICEQCMAISGERLALVGGVSTAMQPWLSSSVSQNIVAAEHGPERGALIYQQHLIQS